MKVTDIYVKYSITCLLFSTHIYFYDISNLKHLTHAFGGAFTFFPPWICGLLKLEWTWRHIAQFLYSVEIQEGQVPYSSLQSKKMVRLTRSPEPCKNGSNIEKLTFN